MFRPRPLPDEEPIASTLKPYDILYYFDEAIIFSAMSRLAPVLCNKTDHDRETNQYLLVLTSGPIIDKLMAGAISVRAAFSQPWCWIVNTDKALNVMQSWGMPLDDLPEGFLPEPGVALYPYQGHVTDAFEVQPTPYLAMRFTGGTLRDPERINFGTFLALGYNVYSSVRKLLAPAFSDLQKLGVTENAFSRMLQIPIRRPALSSLKIEIETPSLNPSALRRPPQIDWEDAQRRIAEAAILFLDAAERVGSAARADELSDSILDEDFATVDAISQIVPSDTSEYEALEISGAAAEGIIKEIQIGPEAGKNIINAHTRHLNDAGTFSGTIVELSVRSSSFILRRQNGREVTCQLPHKAVREEAFAAFQEGARIQVKGALHKRKRRDFMIVEEITLADGTVIRRGNV